MIEASSPPPDISRGSRLSEDERRAVLDSAVLTVDSAGELSGEFSS